MIRVSITGSRATVLKPIPFDLLKVIGGLPGRKKWSAEGVEIDATPINVNILKSSGHDFDWSDGSGLLAELETFEKLATQHAPVEAASDPGDYKPRIPPYIFQQKAIDLSWARRVYALLFEVGLGKTMILIATAGKLYRAGKVTGVLVLAPKGVHRQWAEEGIPDHIDPSVKWHAIVWKGKVPAPAEMVRPGLTFLCMNSEAIRTAKGFKAAERFLYAHRLKSMMVVDESHVIKNLGSSVTKKAIELGVNATYRRIATGTPIARNVMDFFSQFFFLNPNILGHKYLASFRARYCITAGWENKQVVGAKNLEELYTLIAPHSFRLTEKETLGLPPKIMSQRVYEMGEETARHYQSLRKTFMTMLDSGELIDVPSAAVALLRLQQLVCGYLPDENGTATAISSERIEAMMEIVEQSTGPTVIWARFIEDAARINKTLTESGRKVALYRGTDAAKDAAKELFMSGGADYFLANPASAGTGLDGLQHRARNAIFYSNSFNALHRWQAEGRTHRIGLSESVRYFDLIAHRSVDRGILKNLLDKKSISDLTLDEIRQALADES